MVFLVLAGVITGAYFLVKKANEKPVKKDNDLPKSNPGFETPPIIPQGIKDNINRSQAGQKINNFLKV